MSAIESVAEVGVVVASTSASIDGFIAGPNHEMDWIFDHDFLPEGPIGVIDELIETSGAILSGRRTYEVGQRSARAETSAAFGGRWAGSEFVLTHHPPSEPPGSDLTFLSGDIGRAVATALAAADGKNVLILGADITQQCLAADLLDEILLFVLPIVIGDGVRLFDRPGYREALFETVRGEQVGQAVVLHYRRRR